MQAQRLLHIDFSGCTMSDPCQKALIALQKNQPQQALQCLQPVLKRMPAHAQANHLAGIACLNLAQPQKALSFFKQAEKKIPENRLLQEHLVTAYMHCQEYNQALAALKPVLARPEPSVAMQLHAAVASLSLGHQKVAEHLLDQVQARDPKHPLAFFLRGQIAAERHQYDEAQRQAEAGLVHEPNSIEGLSVLAHSHLMRKNYAESARLYKDLYNKDPSNSGRLNNYASSLQGLGQLEEAQRLYRESLMQLLSQDKLPRPRPKDKMSVELAHQALEVFDRMMAQLKIPYFLAFGTALGILRDGRLLPNDKDMDVALPWATPREALVNALEHYGFIYPAKAQFSKGETEGQWLISVIHKITGVTIDLFFAKRDGDYIEMGFDHKPMPIRWRLRRFGLKEIRYRGRNYQVPSPHEQFFEDHYGPDWQKPQHYDGALRGAALTPDCTPLSLCYGYNRLSGYVREGLYKKALVYCQQMRLVVDDPLVDQVAERLERELAEQPAEHSGEARSG